MQQPLKRTILYLGYVKLNKLKVLSSLLSYCAINKIIPDEIKIEDTNKVDFPILLEIQKEKFCIDKLIINQKSDLGPNKIVNELAYEELKKCMSVVEVNNCNIFNNLFALYDKAKNELERLNKSSTSANNLLGYRLEYKGSDPFIITKDSEIKSVNAIFQLRIEQGRNLEQIKAFCNKHNIKQPSGKDIDTRYLIKMFEHMNCYVGFDKMGGELFKNIYPPILLDKKYVEYYLNINYDEPEYLVNKRQYKNLLKKVEI